MELPSFLSIKDAAVLKNRIKTIGLSGIVLVSLLVYYCTGFFDSFTMAAIPLLVFLAIYLLNRLLKDTKNGVSLSLKQGLSFNRRPSVRHLWLLTLVGLAVGFAQAEWKILTLIDLIAIGTCVCVILDAPQSPEAYKPMLKMVAVASSFYAVSVWVQVLCPGLYRLYLGLLQEDVAQRILKLESYVTGFSTNPGHTATYIALGIFAILASSPKRNWQTYVAVAFLVITMAWVGMRMPLLSMCVAVLFFLFLSLSTKNRYRLFFALVAGCAVTVLLVLLFREQLETIPIFRRTIKTIVAIFNGEDFTSGRVGLYKNALNQFANHPLIGIGWGEYRHTVLGTVTQATRFDVHNIYLQLLCETGIIGFVCFVLPMVVCLIMTIRAYYRISNTGEKGLWKTLLAFSLMFQVYFLAFGMADNALYNMCEQVPYFISCSITVAYLCSRNDRKRYPC